MWGDIEVVYVPRVVRVANPAELFGTVEVSLADVEVQRLLGQGLLEKRKSCAGLETWGPKNKLAVYVPRVSRWTCSRRRRSAGGITWCAGRVARR